MKFILCMITIGLLGLMKSGGCEQSPALTGSEDVVVLPGAQFTINSLTIVDNALVAAGAVRNGGTTNYSPYWYAEGDFYSDSTYTFKLGGAVQTFSFVLSGGESTALQLRFTSTNMDVNVYPKFRVKNLRAYRNKE